ncbi:hypothetical protein H5410_020686 [Solanum commersonii]|uniref:Uncharacterized protein n=1 Tax=Solanum commersonii TaxID=4109 RepID=A0A9J5ZAN5_SOLCO|nr:hypothetical protein H5410_020686 [Solanum commersonii]
MEWKKQAYFHRPRGYWQPHPLVDEDISVCAAQPCTLFPQILWKIGLHIIMEWEKRDELVTASAIENIVRKLMTSEEGDDIRKRAEKLGAAVRESIEKGGASQLELNSLTPDLKT